MNVAVIKALTRRIQVRFGSNAAAATAAGVQASVWSDYCSDAKPTITIPFHRLLEIATPEERRAFADVLLDGEDADRGCLATEASEATEAAADLQRTVRLATADGELTPREARSIVDQALNVQAQAADVIRLAGRRA